MAAYDIFGLILAALCGGAIGVERELSGKAAGLKTNVLICIGAAVFSIISKQFGGALDGSVTRIAAQIVTGVGFLGAGAIIQDRAGVHGLTTAATIWLVASIGMACGVGFYWLALIATALAIAVLFGLPYMSKFIVSLRHPSRVMKKQGEETAGDRQNE